MKKILIFLFIIFNFVEVSKADNLILYCPEKLTSAADDIYYINISKKTVSGIEINKKNKLFEVYDWYFDNVQFSKDIVSFNDDGNFLYHIPENFPFFKSEINRKSLKVYHYQKDRNDLPAIIKQGPSIIEDQARKLLSWKIYGSKQCKILEASKYKLKFMNKNEVLKRNFPKERNKF